MERPQYTGRGTVMTAPVRHASPNPERDAPRGTGDGMVAIGRGMQSLAGSLDQMQDRKNRELKQMQDRKNRELKQISDEKKRIADRDAGRFAQTAAKEAATKLAEEYPNLGEIMPDAVGDVQGRWRKNFDEIFAEKMKLNPEGTVEASEMDAIVSNYAGNYQNIATGNRDTLLVAQRYEGTSTEIGQALQQMPAVIGTTEGDTALFIADGVMEYINGWSGSEYTPQFQAKMRESVIKDVNQNFFASVAGASPKNRDAMLASAEKAVEKGYMSKPDFVRFKAAVENRLVERQAFDTESAKEVNTQAMDRLTTGAAVGANSKQAVTAAIQSKTYLVGKGKAVGAPAEQAIVREALLASLDGHVQKGTRSNLSSNILPSSRFAPQGRGSAEQMAAAFNSQFTSASDDVLLANVKQLARDAKLPDEAVGGWEAVESITSTEARQFASRTQGVLNERVAMINRGQSNILVEQTEGLQDAIDAVGGDPREVMKVYRTRNAMLGVDPNKAVNIPTGTIREWASSLSSGDPGTRALVLTDIVRNYGTDSLMALRSMATLMKTNKDGKPTAEPLLSNDQIAAAHLSIIPQLARNSTGESRQKALNFTYHAQEAISAEEQIKTSRSTLGGKWEIFDAEMKSTKVQAMLEPYVLAAQYDRYGGDSLKQGLPALIKRIAEHNFSRNGATSDPLEAINDAIKVVSASVVPIRDSTEGSNSYSFEHVSRNFEDNFLQFRQFGQSANLRQYRNARAAMGDVALIGSRPKGIGTNLAIGPAPAGAGSVNPVFTLDEDVANSFFGNLFGYNSTARGRASLIATERINPLFGENEGSVPRFKPFGSMELDYGNMHIVNGSETPVNVADIVAMERSSWMPKETLLRFKAQLAGREGVSPDVAAAVLVGQNHKWVPNYEKGTRELWIKAASIDGVEQPGSMMQVMKKDKNGSFVPVEYSIIDGDLSYDIGVQSMPGYLLDSSPFTGN